jgi:DNA-binding IclR family transcriptional regulator
MAHTYEDLKKKSLAELREIAKDLQHDAVQGYTQMNKDHLLPAVCQALGIDMHVHHGAHAASLSGVRHRMKELKAKRQAAVDAHDHDTLRAIRREYHRLNHRLRVDARKEEASQKPA